MIGASIRSYISAIHRTADIRVFRLAEPPQAYCLIPNPTDCVPLSVLRTMSLRVLRAKLARALQLPHNAPLRLWVYVISDDRSVGAIEMDGNRNLDWWGVANGSIVSVLPH